MTRIAVAGAAGRMGQRIVACILNDVGATGRSPLQLGAAFERVGADVVGQDVAVIAGQKACGVLIGDNVEGALESSDVLIDFSHHTVTVPNLEAVVRLHKAIVIGTTGHTDEEKIAIKELSQKAPVVMAPNMSVGVNVMWKLIAEAARALGEHFPVTVSETHHTKKLDSPSGTAVKIGEVLAGALEKKYEDIPIASFREGDVVGDHTVLFSSLEETLEVTHHAINRDIFARGSIQAAQWIVNQSAGLYDMQDVLGLR